MELTSVFLSVLLFGPGSEGRVEAAGVAPPANPAIDLADAEGPALPALQEEKKEKQPWTGAVNAGVSASYGNTRISTITFTATSEYKLDDKNRVSGLFDWLYSEEKDNVTKTTRLTQRRVRGAAQYDRFFNEKLYGYARADAIHDDNQNLELRLMSSVGAGYDFVDTDEQKISAEAGLAWIHEDFDATSPDGHASLRFAGKYFRQITETLAFRATLEWLPSLEDQDDHLVYSTNQLEVNLSDGLVTTLRYEFDYDNTPQPGNERLDHRIIWGLGYTF